MDEQYRPEIRERAFSFLAEREKLLSNLEAARRISEEGSILTSELRRVYEDVAFTEGDVRSLKERLNRTAIEFGLQPILVQRRKL